MRLLRPLSTAFVIAALVGASCARTTTPTDKGQDDSPPGGNSGVIGSQQQDWAAIEQLETQAKALAKTAGCTASGDCRAAAVGSRACGGPRYYIPWCAKTTDSAALFRKLDEVAAAEREYNRKHQILSTCEFRMPPAVESVGGSCVAR
jgi:hypothetical protein